MKIFNINKGKVLMSTDYIKLILNTMGALPPEKQIEVYDFATYLRDKNKKNVKKSIKKTSILKLIGIGDSGCSDISKNHDKYLYE